MGYQEDFINKIAPYVQQWRDFFGWGVASAIIGQACLESAYGRSNKAVQANNYFGLKYRDNRVTCNSGYIIDTSSEQLPDGTYITIKTKWYAFADMNTGVEGYFQFIDTGNYPKAKQATTPEGYLQALKDAGYATSQKYVENAMRVVETYNLTQYDEVKTMIPDSTLVKGCIPSPNYTEKRKFKIDTIIVHCMAGLYDAIACGNSFANPNRQASSHYGISSNGEIYQYVNECHRAWTTGGDKVCNGWTGSDYDHRSITMEVSNTTLAPNWEVSPQALQSIINLCADICRRNNIKELKWYNDPKLVGDASKQNMALHRWFASKACPGNYLVANMANIALSVNQQLQGGSQYILYGYDYSPVFDPVFYSNNYPDLKSAFGDNADMLWLHFQQYGMNEFRQASAEFNPVVYKAKYEDLRNVFRDDKPMYYWHYVAFGKSEGRTAV